jgi:hypothetical protein
METTQQKELSLEEKLNSEVRVCPQCRYELRDPFLQRCPRCFSSVPVVDPGCRGCFHRKSCPVAKII